MSLKYFIYDTNDNWNRANRLELLLKAKDATVTPIGTPLSDVSTEDVILHHSSDFEGAVTRTTLKTLAERGKLVIAYSAGAKTPPDAEGIHYRSFSDVERLLRWTQKDWTVSHLRKALNSEWTNQQARGFTALAILAQCASAKVLGAEVLKRQNGWRTDANRWKAALDSVPVQPMRDRAAEADKQNAVQLLDWINAGGCAPNFEEAAVEAEQLAS